MNFPRNGIRGTHYSINTNAFWPSLRQGEGGKLPDDGWLVEPKKQGDGTEPLLCGCETGNWQGHLQMQTVCLPMNKTKK